MKPVRNCLIALSAMLVLAACGGHAQPPLPDIRPAEGELDRHTQALTNAPNLTSARDEAVLHRDNMGRVLVDFRGEASWMGSGGGCACGDPEAMQAMMDNTATIDADVQRHHDLVAGAQSMDEVHAECLRYHQEVSGRISAIRANVGRMSSGCGGMMNGGGMMGN